jgi:hypothetical protein
MKAGQALGLLAGMGALSALGRGKDLRGNRFTGLMDMIDGGGGGKSGDRFEGGGLLSMLGNLFAKPYEAQQRVEDIATRASARDRDSSPKPVLRETSQADAEAAMGLNPFGGVGSTVTPPDVLGSSQGLLAAQAANEAAMGLDPFGSVGPMRYSGRGNLGMPREAMQYSGRGTAEGSSGGMQYSGRGDVGMNDRTGMRYSGRGDVGMPVQPEMVYSGRGTSVGGFSPNLYASMIDDLMKIDPDFVNNADNQTLMDMYSTYVQNGGSLY